MQPPENVTTYETGIATFWVDESGIVIMNTKNNIQITIDNLKNTFDVLKELSSGNKVCLLDELTGLSAPNKECRDYAAAEAPAIIKALAFVTKSYFSNMVAKIVLTLNILPFPAKMFLDENEAKEWLKQYL